VHQYHTEAYSPACMHVRPTTFADEQSLRTHISNNC